jgi:hypothetical protein
VKELTAGHPERIRICDNDTCRWVFYDTSRTPIDWGLAATYAMALLAVATVLLFLYFRLIRHGERRKPENRTQAPIAAQAFLKTSVAIGGTSILILVSVALETLRAVESRALMVTYDQYSEPSFFGDDETDQKPKKRRLSFRRKSKSTKTSKNTKNAKLATA